MVRTGKYRKILVAGFLLALALFAFVSLPGHGRAEFSVSAMLSPTTFSVDDGAQLTVTVNGTRSAELEIPETASDGFEIIQRGRSSQINMINGQFSSAITFTCLVRGYKPGNYTIPPITVSGDGTTRTTDTIPFTVIDPSQTGQGGSGAAVLPPTADNRVAGAGKTAFARLVIGKTTSYVGEIIPVEVKAYFQKGLRASLNSAPALIGDGLVMAQLNDKPVQTEETVNGNRYSVLTWQTAISNIKEGEHTVHLEQDATLLIPERRMSTSVFGRRSPFDDDFFDSVFGGYKEKPIKVTSEDMTFVILPLPDESRPADFSGAIGDFNLQISVAPIEAETGEPLTLTMTINGSGNFDRVEAPSFPDSDDWKTYSPSATFHGAAADGFTGSKVFEQAIVARNSGVTEIPPLAFSYFDPQQGSYITRTSAPIPVTITGKAPAVPTAVNTVTVPESGPSATAVPTSQPHTAQQPVPQTESFHGLAPQHLETGRTVAVIAPLYTRPLFLAAMVLCTLTLLVALGLKLHRLREESQPEDRRRRQMAQALQASFALMDKGLAEGDSTVFLGICRAVIQQHLGSIWCCQPSAITRADLAARLPQSHPLLEIFTIAEQAAYSGCRLDDETLLDYAATVKSELEKLS